MPGGLTNNLAALHDIYVSGEKTNAVSLHWVFRQSDSVKWIKQETSFRVYLKKI